MTNTTITLQSVGGDSPQTIIELEGGVVSLGREPENGVVVDSEAVSRQHACIGAFGSQWVFWDLGSTNGSWLNGDVVNGSQIRLLRIGDVLQLADFAFRIADRDGFVPENGVIPFTNESTLLVFDGGVFQKEVSMQMLGAQFVVGGPDSDVSLGDYVEPLASLSIVRTKSGLELSVSPHAKDVYVDGVLATGTSILQDRAEIVFRDYSFIVNLPELGSVSTVTPAQFTKPEEAPHELHEVAAYDRYNLPEHLRGRSEDWESETGRRNTNRGRKFVFEEPVVPDAMQQTQSKLDALSVFETPEDARFGRGLSSLHQASLSTVAEPRSLLQRVAIGVGVFLVLVFFAWALSSMATS